MDMEQENFGPKPKELVAEEIKQIEEQIASREGRTEEDDPALASLRAQLETLRNQQ